MKVAVISHDCPVSSVLPTQVLVSENAGLSPWILEIVKGALPTFVSVAP
jgi:hypothetical protein